MSEQVVCTESMCLSRLMSVEIMPEEIDDSGTLVFASFPRKMFVDKECRVKSGPFYCLLEPTLSWFDG